jgi:hypothetical protein
MLELGDRDALGDRRGDLRREQPAPVHRVSTRYVFPLLVGREVAEAERVTEAPVERRPSDTSGPASRNAARGGRVAPQLFASARPAIDSQSPSTKRRYSRSGSDRSEPCSSRGCAGCPRRARAGRTRAPAARPCATGRRTSAHPARRGVERHQHERERLAREAGDDERARALDRLRERRLAELVPLFEQEPVHLEPLPPVEVGVLPRRSPGTGSAPTRSRTGSSTCSG